MDSGQTLMLHEQLQGLPPVQVVNKFAVGANAGEGKPVDKLPLPEHAESAATYVFVAAYQADQLRSRGEAVTQNRLDDVEVAVGDDASARLFGPHEFCKAGHVVCDSKSIVVGSNPKRADGCNW